jgi:hypothetical protein
MAALLHCLVVFFLRGSFFPQAAILQCSHSHNAIRLFPPLHQVFVHHQMFAPALMGNAGDADGSVPVLPVHSQAVAASSPPAKW